MTFGRVAALDQECPAGASFTGAAGVLQGTIWRF